MATISEFDLRLVLQAMDELRLIEEHMGGDAFFGPITLHNTHGYIIGDIVWADDQWALRADAYGTNNDH